jgi:hypothetical protein
MSRICLRCRGDMTLMLQESGGERWAAPIQSPVPVGGGSRLTRTQRAIIFSFVVLFGVAQLLVAFAPRQTPQAPTAIPGGR